MVVLSELEADRWGQAAQKQHGEETGPLLAWVNQLQHLRQKLRRAALTKRVGGEKALRLLARGELMRRQQGRLQVGVARVAWSGEDVGHPSSGSFRKHR